MRPVPAVVSRAGRSPGSAGGRAWGAIALGALLSLVPPLPARAADSCTECHGMQDEQRLRAPVAGFAKDIHAERGLGCASCHGGDPKDEDVTAMDPDKGFRGAMDHTRIAEMCASCHANAAFMKHYNPRPYIFSLDEFRTSVHYRLGARGDTRVATCTSCHGVHGIRPHSEPGSPVYATNVPKTCAKCHNPVYMKGRGIPTDQYERYSTGVHGVALLEKGDVSAPACNDCHGNHGAAPPGLRDVTMVCGTCHGREAELFDGSRMKAGLDKLGKPGCVTCHGNHGVQPPTDAMLSTGPGGSCRGCHAAGSAAERGTQQIISSFRRLGETLSSGDSLLHEAEVLGMETSPGRESLKEGQDHLVGVRAGLHSFDAAQVGGVLAEGIRAGDQAVANARAALRDWRTRRVGMALSVGVILILIALVYAKVRRLES